uniref:DNA-directed RNA polymerase subunit beta-like subunit n=1 Tax=Babesia orientalis TaxID=273649 RepID=A0A0M5LBB6_9APIC|nr:DNA-directed RNA polymerase subunit beta-like subunit [Babesia orientalis]ALE29341.1 DNA-directed RNA polymerase subunit beta-like subunit [Babesia orientalis]
MSFIHNHVKYKTLEKNIKVNYNLINKLNLNFTKYVNNNFMCYFVKNLKHTKLPTYKTKDTNLTKINKLFEGRYPETVLNIGLYTYINIVNKTYITHNNFTVYNIIPVSVTNIKSSYYVNSLALSSGLISFPLSVNDVLNINNYIYYIYKYIYIKNTNSYKSTLSALFYYFIGLFLSILSLYAYNKIKILYSNLIIVVSKLSNFIIINKLHKYTLKYTKLENLKIINIINNSLKMSNYLDLFEYKPYLIGLTKYTMCTAGVLAKLSFQETLRTLQTVLLKTKIDWCVDIKSNLITSNFIPVGSGWYRYFTN